MSAKQLEFVEVVTSCYPTGIATRTLKIIQFYTQFEIL